MNTQTLVLALALLSSLACNTNGGDQSPAAGGPSAPEVKLVTLTVPWFKGMYEATVPEGWTVQEGRWTFYLPDKTELRFLPWMNGDTIESLAAGIKADTERVSRDVVVTDDVIRWTTDPSKPGEEPWGPHHILVRVQSERGPELCSHDNLASKDLADQAVAACKSLRAKK